MSAESVNKQTIRILLVEDDEEDFMLLRIMLRRIREQDYQLDWTRTYESAIEIISQRRHDILFFDYKLGDHNGIELLNEISAKGSRTPVILLTGLGDRKIDMQAMAAGAADYLVKGKVDEVLLERTIRYALERKQHEDQIRKLNAELESKVQIRTRELQKTVDELQQFIYVSTHDLQEPLRMVNSYTRLLEQRYKGRIDDQADHYIEIICDNAVRMYDLINDLLKYLCLDDGGQQRVPTDSAESFKEAVKNLSAAIQETNAKVTCGPLPTVPGNPAKLTHLFQNLVSNSIKFRGKNPPEIRVEAKDNDKEWIFSVRDNGIGIEPQYKDLIFIIFQRLHTHKTYPGTGMGLAICKKIAEQLGGSIWMESEFGKGTVFYFTVPK